MGAQLVKCYYFSHVKDFKWTKKVHFIIRTCMGAQIGLTCIYTDFFHVFESQVGIAKF